MPFVCFIIGAGGYAQAPATEAPEETAPRSLPADAMTLSRALALALEKNPELAAYSWDIRAAEARALQARLLPNPELSVEVEGIRWNPGPQSTTVTRNSDLSVGWDREERARSGFGQAEVTIALSQLVELGGKRAKRIRLAKRGQDIAAWDYEVARADVLAQVAQAFVDVLAAQERVTLSRELMGFAEEAERATAARAQAGKISPIELKKAQIARSSVGVEVQRTTRELQAARVRLAATWGKTMPTFEKAVGHFDAIAPLPALEDLQTAITSVPDIARWTAEMEQRHAALRLEKSMRIPDIELKLGMKSERLESGEGAGYGWGTGGASFSRSHSSFDRERDNTLLFEVSLPLPLFNRNQGSIKEAQHLISKGKEEERAARTRIRAGVADAYYTTLAVYEENETLKTEVLPLALETFELTQRGFRHGKFSYLEALDAQRTLVEARIRFLDAQAAYHQGVVELERLTGQSIHSLDGTASAASKE